MIIQYKYLFVSNSYGNIRERKFTYLLGECTHFLTATTSILDLFRTVVTPKTEWKRTVKRDDIEENQGLIQHKAVESFTKYVFIVVMIVLLCCGVFFLV